MGFLVTRSGNEQPHLLARLFTRRALAIQLFLVFPLSFEQRRHLFTRDPSEGGRYDWHDRTVNSNVEATNDTYVMFEPL